MRQLSARSVIVQSAACHPEWDGVDHASYLKHEVVCNEQHVIDRTYFGILVRKCQATLRDRSVIAAIVKCRTWPRG